METSCDLLHDAPNAPARAVLAQEPHRAWGFRGAPSVRLRCFSPTAHARFLPPSPRRPLIALVFAVLCVALSGAATVPQEASAKIRFGYGDARPDMFSDPLWQRLPLRHVRRLVDWDTPRRPEKLAKLDTWMEQAQATGAIPLLAIDKSWTEGQERKRPSVAQYERLIEFLRERYPWWKRLTPWNEANHSAQPTYRSPRLAWLYYLAARRACTAARSPHRASWWAAPSPPSPTPGLRAFRRMRAGA